MSWYCGKPNDNNLLCHDWVETKLRTPPTKLPLTEAEKRLLTKDAIGRIISDEIIINVSKERNKTLQCKEWTLSSLWNQTSPTGFFIRKKWNSLLCINEMNKDLHMKCMNGTRLYLLGDSTLRQWYIELKDLLDCEPNSESWTKEKWHKPASCFNTELDFGMQWLPHAFPFFTGPNFELRRYKRPIIAYIDEIDSRTKAIVVVHLYAHFISYHPDVFRDRFKSVVVSARNLLTRNPHAIILIKGPHSFKGAGGEYDRLNDYFGYVYKDIMLEEIGDLRDRVIYLDIMDMTIAEDIPEIHPNMDIVREMKLKLSSPLMSCLTQSLKSDPWEEGANFWRYSG
ncbi:hypothetical protein ACJMK2_005028 [Sinanodonta woodiana]|uniref:NXPE C-terminal domain-containing protein n=1 Tax=Sinanodonta woodiana TaxID=1069815 RepID=A0ABD3VRT3_SINWO